MHTTLAIQITKEDIKKGIASNCEKCAGALAMRRAMRNRGLSVDDLICFGAVILKEKTKDDFTRETLLSNKNEELKKWQECFDFWKTSDGVKAPLPAEFILFLE